VDVTTSTGPKGRQRNGAYRVREHLTEAEMNKLLAALKRDLSFGLLFAGDVGLPSEDCWRSVLRTGVPEPTPLPYPVAPPSPVQIAVGWRR
jgi:hypothetical protein